MFFLSDKSVRPFAKTVGDYFSGFIHPTSELRPVRPHLTNVESQPPGSRDHAPRRTADSTMRRGSRRITWAMPPWVLGISPMSQRVRHVARHGCQGGSRRLIRDHAHLWRREPPRRLCCVSAHARRSRCHRGLHRARPGCGHTLRRRGRPLALRGFLRGLRWGVVTFNLNAYYRWPVRGLPG